MGYIPKVKKPRPRRTRPKYCPRCQIVKMPWGFSKSLHQWDGLQIWCKECFKELYHIRIGRIPDPKKHIDYNPQWRGTWWDD